MHHWRRQNVWATQQKHCYKSRSLKLMNWTMHAFSRQAHELTSQQNAWFSLSDMKWLLSTKESLQDAIPQLYAQYTCSKLHLFHKTTTGMSDGPFCMTTMPVGPFCITMLVGPFHMTTTGMSVGPFCMITMPVGPFYMITAGMSVGPFHTTTGMQVGPVCMTTTGMTISDICNQQAQCTKQSSTSTPWVKPGASHCWRYCYNMQVWLGHSDRTSVHSQENRPTKQATLQLSDKQCSAAGFSTCEFLERQRNPDSINLNSPTETKESHAWLVEEKQKRQGHIWGTDGHQTATLHKQVTFKGCHDNTWAKQESTGDWPAPPANERNEYKIGRKKKPSYPW